MLEHAKIDSMILFIRLLYSRVIVGNRETLINKYNGSLTKLHREAENDEDLENKLANFYGIGPVTENIFLRELRPFWEKSDPKPLCVIKKLLENTI